MIFTTLYNAKIQKLPWHTYLTALLPAIGGTAVAAGSGFLFSLVVPTPNWIELILISVSISTVYAILVVLFGLSTEEKGWIFQFFKGAS
jgi:hypothetical protein